MWLYVVNLDSHAMLADRTDGMGGEECQPDPPPLWPIAPAGRRSPPIVVLFAFRAVKQLPTMHRARLHVRAARADTGDRCKVWHYLYLFDSKVESRSCEDPCLSSHSLRRTYIASSSRVNSTRNLCNSLPSDNLTIHHPRVTLVVTVNRATAISSDDTVPIILPCSTADPGATVGNPSP